MPESDVATTKHLSVRISGDYLNLEEIQWFKEMAEGLEDNGVYTVEEFVDGKLLADAQPVGARLEKTRLNVLYPDLNRMHLQIITDEGAFIVESGSESERSERNASLPTDDKSKKICKEALGKIAEKLGYPSLAISAYRCLMGQNGQDKKYIGHDGKKYATGYFIFYNFLSCLFTPLMSLIPTMTTQLNHSTQDSSIRKQKGKEGVWLFEKSQQLVDNQSQKAICTAKVVIEAQVVKNDSGNTVGIKIAVKEMSIDADLSATGNFHAIVINVINEAKRIARGVGPVDSKVENVIASQLAFMTVQNNSLTIQMGEGKAVLYPITGANGKAVGDVLNKLVDVLPRWKGDDIRLLIAALSNGSIETLQSLAGVLSKCETETLQSLAGVLSKCDSMTLAQVVASLSGPDYQFEQHLKVDVETLVSTQRLFMKAFPHDQDAVNVMLRAAMSYRTMEEKTRMADCFGGYYKTYGACRNPQEFISVCKSYDLAAYPDKDFVLRVMWCSKHPKQFAKAQCKSKAAVESKSEDGLAKLFLVQAGAAVSQGAQISLDPSKVAAVYDGRRSFWRSFAKYFLGGLAVLAGVAVVAAAIVFSGGLAAAPLTALAASKNVLTAIFAVNSAVAIGGGLAGAREQDKIKEQVRAKLTVVEEIPTAVISPDHQSAARVTERLGGDAPVPAKEVVLKGGADPKSELPATEVSARPGASVGGSFS